VSSNIYDIKKAIAIKIAVNMDIKKRSAIIVMHKIEYSPIGIIHSPFKSPEGTPIQPSAAKGVHGEVDVYPEFAEGLDDLAGFSHVILLYHFHLSKKYNLKVKPFLDDEHHGLFATRDPARPNPIGLSVVRLTKIDNTTLHVGDIDIVDKTPLLDIKPYVAEFDVRAVGKTGWLEKKTKEINKTVDDGRFAE
jgi:tRNA-Thr(GGU) m(6)t(6)A37 methyltransferase TsaA